MNEHIAKMGKKRRSTNTQPPNEGSTHSSAKAQPAPTVLREENSLDRKDSDEMKAAPKAENASNPNAALPAASVHPFNWDYGQLISSFDREIHDESRLIEERIQAMRDLYLQAIKDHLVLQKTASGLQARESDLQAKQEESVQELEAQTQKLEKASAVRATLQSLADELQRQRQTLLDQARELESEDIHRRQQISDQFLEKIQGISAQLEQQSSTRTSLIAENDSLREQLRTALDRYSSREQDFEAEVKWKTSRLESFQELHTQLEQTAKTEHDNCESYQEHIKHLMVSESDLRVQLNVYATKFEQFQEALNTSNDMFSQFKKKLDEMTKTTRRLEKENAELVDRAQKGKETAAELWGDADYLRSKLLQAQKRNETLQNLCAALESENATARVRARDLKLQVQEATSGQIDQPPPPESFQLDDVIEAISNSTH